jgi:hypothetical protein
MKRLVEVFCIFISYLFCYYFDALGFAVSGPRPGIFPAGAPYTQVNSPLTAAVARFRLGGAGRKDRDINGRDNNGL